jgi:transcriptional regulator with XRE-family HTH domain
MADVAQLFVDAMQQEGVTRIELSRRLGYDKATVTQTLRGNRNLTLRTLLDMAGALNKRVVITLE